MALDIKFGVCVNIDSFNSIMKRYEKKKKIVFTTLQPENGVRKTGSMTQPLLNSIS
jgi:hypothetical protein